MFQTMREAVVHGSHLEHILKDERQNDRGPSRYPTRRTGKDQLFDEVGSDGKEIEDEPIHQVVNEVSKRFESLENTLKNGFKGYNKAQNPSNDKKVNLTGNDHEDGTKQGF